MKLPKFGIVLLIWLKIILGLDYHYDVSPRITALGNDFAGVIKDLPTDIEIRNPAQLLGYRALIISHKGHHYYWEMPLNFAIFYNQFGLALHYGEHFFLNTNPDQPKNQFYRFNLSGFWSRSNFGLQYDIFLEDWTVDYPLARCNQNLNFHSLTLGIQPKNLTGFDFRTRLGLGYYDSTYFQFQEGQLIPSAKTDFFVPSLQVGLSYEREISADNALNFLIDLGGPASGFELKRLPVPFPSTVSRDELGKPARLSLFANSFTTRTAVSFTTKPTPSLLIALGVNDFWSGVKTKEENPTTTWFNILALPLGLEYKLNENVILRGGIKGEYYYQYSFQQTAKTVVYWWRSQSFGLGCHFGQNWYLDLASLSNPLVIESIDLMVRKEW
ncbi:MAG: hypothetical protein ABIK67_02240 [candidate division WOR-3 bacterium]